MSRYTMTIRFKTTKTGRPIAHYWMPISGRWLPIGIDEAELRIATGRAHRQDAGEQPAPQPVQWNGQTARQRVGGTFGS